MLTPTYEEREDENREIKISAKTNNNSSKTKLVIEGREDIYSLFHFSKIAVLNVFIPLGSPRYIHCNSQTLFIIIPRC